MSQQLLQYTFWCMGPGPGIKSHWFPVMITQLVYITICSIQLGIPFVKEGKENFHVSYCTVISP
jgi:hypothetical protein